LDHMIIELLRAVTGLALILFIPGYALTWALYPRWDDLDIYKRIAFSFALSISLVMIFMLFIDLVLGIDITPINIVTSIFFLTLFFLLIWRVHLFIINKNLKSKMIIWLIESIDKLFIINKNLKSKMIIWLIESRDKLKRK
jgi:uncharacterized membrane protein